MRANDWNNRTRDEAAVPLSGNGTPATPRLGITVLNPDTELDAEGGYIYIQTRGGGIMELQLGWVGTGLTNETPPARLFSAEFHDPATGTFIPAAFAFNTSVAPNGGGQVNYTIPWGYDMGRLRVGLGWNETLAEVPVPMPVRMVISFGPTVDIPLTFSTGGVDDLFQPRYLGTRNPQGTDLIINEIMAKGGEFIELYNPTGSAINLAGWQIQIGSNVYTISSGSISAGGYFVLDKNSFTTNVGNDWIPDSGATMSLINPSSTTVDQVTYPATNNAAKSWSRYVNAAGIPVDTDNDSNDFFTGQKTPNASNAVKNPGAVIPEFQDLLVPSLIALLGLLIVRKRRGGGRTARAKILFTGATIDR
jgi:hypothetical protein